MEILWLFQLLILEQKKYYSLGVNWAKPQVEVLTPKMKIINLYGDDQLVKNP